MRGAFLPAALALTLAVGLCGCKRAPTFAERYDAASAHIGETAGEIDAQVSGAPIPDESAAPE